MSTARRFRSSSRLGAGVAGIACVSALLIAGCGRDAATRHDQERETERQRRLYADLAAPLTGGHDALRVALADARARCVAFRLGDGGADQVDAPAQDGLSDEALAVFFVCTRDDRREILLFDPRSFSLTALSPEGGKVSIARALASSLRGDHGLDVHRFDFALADGGPKAAGHARLTDHGHAALPLVWPEREVVVFADDRSGNRLMAVPVGGGAARPLTEDAFGASFAARRALDGGLIFAGGPGEGAYRLWRLSPGDAAPTPYEATADAAPPTHVLSFAERDGRLEPVLLDVPRRPDLAALAALVEARNPAISRRRALLAAALIEARQARLALRPTLHTGVYWSPEHGIAVSPGFTGDVLAEGLARGVVGLVQPLLDWKRIDALADGALSRAEVARAVLDLEIETRLGETLEHAWAARAWNDAVARDAEAVAAAETAASATQARRDGGAAGPVETAVAARDLAAAIARRDLNARQLALHCDELRRLAALGPEAPIAADALPAAPDEIRPYADLRRLAELNQPRLRAARHALIEAFHVGRSGSAHRPGASIGVEYGQSRQDFADPVDDYILLSLSGSLPTGWFADRKLSAQRARTVLAAYAAGEEIEAAQVARELEEAYVAWWRARGDAQVAEAAVTETAARSRQARLRAVEGEPDAERGLDQPALAAIDRTAMVAAQDAATARAEAAVRLARLWRVAGVARGALRPAPAIPDAIAAPIAANSAEATP
ncbi:MAG TPA: TolC family protein [Planctomycetota bacterium]|nr:TolC family protein [Planctomycetota bacterium]